MKEQMFPSDNSGKYYGKTIVIIGFLMFAVLSALLVNTAGLNQRLHQNMQNYANDISAQLASNISSRMKMRETYIRNLADTFSDMDVQQLTEELLERKADYLDMESVFVLYEDGTTIPEKIPYENLDLFCENHPELYENSQVFVTGDESVYFSAPVLQGEGENRALLVGVRSNSVLQKMLQDVDLKNQGLSCITDKQGRVIVSATDTAPFKRLNDIFLKSGKKEDVKEAGRVMADVEAKRSGTAQFKDINGESLILGYNFLGINDWMLLTILPSNLFGKGMEVYLFYYSIIIVLMAVIMLFIFRYIILEYRRSFKTISHMAMTDSLTGGNNGLAFQMEGGQILKEHPEHHYGIYYVNIKGFKRYNEQFGVETGNKILRLMYQILSSCLHEGELVSRASADHFYMLLSYDREEEFCQRLENIAEILMKKLQESYSVESSDLIRGAYLVKNHSTDMIILSDRAKTASTYQTENNVCRFYDEALGKQIDREQLLEESFERAIKNHEFELYIQPKVCLETDAPGGGEVLVRWRHPEFGLLFPGDFIPLFERDGKICRLDLYMFEETCRLLKKWMAEGIRIPLSVNLSRAHLISNDFSFLDQFYEIKRAYEIPDNLLELELTESLMLERTDFRLVTEMIDKMRSMGFLCSMDDFGFGNSSLTLLKDLNVTTVKLDRQFFLGETPKSWIVVHQLIHLAHELGMTVVAEGIEEQEQVSRLKEYHCDLVQGYVYARPMPISDFLIFIKN